MFAAVAAGAIAVGGIVYWLTGTDAGDGAHVRVVVPALAGIAAQGETVFNEKCATCHGANAAGSRQGPPLVHRIYEPSHHSDRSFYLAVSRGVRAHHWSYGNMPYVNGVPIGDIRAIVAYVRELQRANGIF